MSTRYYLEDAGWTSSVATNKSNILPWEVNVLLQWHHQDPVSAKEIARNDSIYYKYQNNRNPYIDHPEWADSIWKVTVFPTSIEEARAQPFFSLYPNPAEDGFKLENWSGTSQDIHIVVTALNGAVIYEEEQRFDASLQIDCSAWAKGIYFISVVSEKGVSNLKFIKN
jgi:hypothetical protein